MLLPLSLIFSFSLLGFLVFSVSLLVFLIFFLFSLFSMFLSCYLLCTSMTFYTACCAKIYHFYPLTTFGFVGLLPGLPTGLAAALPPPLHCVSRVMPHSQTKVVFVLFSTSFCTPIWIRARILSYQSPIACT